MKRLWSLRGCCVFFLMALGVLSPLVSACDGGNPPAGSTPPEASPTQDLGLSATPGGEITSDMLTGVAEQATPTLAPTPAGLTEADAANIYATVVDALLGEKLPAAVYISPYVGRGDRLDEPDESQAVPASLLSVLTPESDVKYGLSDFSSVIGPLDDGGKVQDNGAFITLGTIAADPADPNGVIVRGSIYRKVGNAEGYRFRLTRDPSKRTGWNEVDSTQEWNDSGT